MYYIITADSNDYLSPLVAKFKEEPTFKFFTAKEFVASGIQIKPDDKFYIPSDLVYPAVRAQIDSLRQKIIDNFRDKYKFRQLLRDIFPNFNFQLLPLTELTKLQIDKKQKFIVKPAVGFMGVGARIIDAATDLVKLRDTIIQELAKYADIYPGLFSREVIVEEYISGGDEYAVDMFYGENGEVNIVNIYCHPQARRQEYLQMLYYTSQEIFAKYYQPIVDFFDALNKKLKVHSLPIHAEFKLDGAGSLIPIEFNSCRFGGMGLADLTYYAFGFSPLKAYFANSQPVWQEIWQQHLGKYFCWILGYNAADFVVKSLLPNHEKFQKMLPNNAQILAYEKLNHTKLPGFALAYLVTQNQDDVEKILDIEFNEVFR
jgi:hypothetical protein